MGVPVPWVPNMSDGPPALSWKFPGGMQGGIVKGGISKWVMTVYCIKEGKALREKMSPVLVKYE